MEILKLRPAYKDYIWGGTKLRSDFGKKTDVSPLAESWEMSCHDDGLSVIDGGRYNGETLKKYISDHPLCLGSSCVSDDMPVLIKLIDAADDLSVQVHPNDEEARRLEGQNGKTEMWYVIDADEGAKITYGVKRDTDAAELRAALVDNRIEELLNKVDSKKGDVFFVYAGTIHAIGKGNLIAEIQQNSNVTYRFYDYNRVGKDGKPRELHIEKALMVADCKKTHSPAIKESSDGVRILGQCEYFCVCELMIKKDRKMCADDESYHALVATEGEFCLSCGGRATHLKAGETAFVPAGLGDYDISGFGTLLFVKN